MIQQRNNRKIGTIYEEQAAAYMRNRNMTILEMNYRCKQGEIDIIAQDGEYLVFTEVKYRSSIRTGYPAEAVTVSKQQRIRRVAEYYLYKHTLSEMTKVRFDVISILADDITYYENAF